VAKFPHIGFKFGRWLDVLWMQKTLEVVPDAPRSFIPFGEL
jgi:L-amino acid N-acyltransferase YncA